jgi:hypothetical protein
MSGPLFTDEQNVRDVFPLVHIMQTTGGAQQLTFRVPRACVIESLEYCVDTEGNADNVHRVDLRDGSTVLFTSLPTAPDTVTRTTTLVGGSASRDAGDILNILIAAPTGTTAASTGGYVAVYAYKR